MPLGSQRVSRKEWQIAGGLKNPRCWRTADDRGAWLYWIRR